MSAGAKRQQRWVLNGETVIRHFNDLVTQMRLSGKPAVVELVAAKRSLDQNAMAFALYKQIGEQCQDQSIVEIRRECKLCHGIPILRAEDEKFRAMYDKSIKHTLSYEEKLEAMEWFPVTRLMSKTQFTEYLDTIIREYSKQGYSLLHPSEEAA